MSKTISHVALITLFFLVLLCAFGNQAWSSLNDMLAGSGQVPREKSALEGRAYTELPEFTLASFQEGTYQSEMESFLSDNIPDRENALLFNADLQRGVIQLAALPLGYQIYPTFFGSDVAYNQQNGTLNDIPSTRSKKRIRKLETFAKRLEDLAANFPQERFLVMSPPRSNYLEDSPLAALVPNAMGQDEVKEALTGQLDKATYVDFPSSHQNREAWFYKTDHHWNMDGAYEGYKILAEALGHGDSLVVKGEKNYESPAFYGSYTRDGLFDDFSDTVFDYNFDLPLYEVKIDGEKQDMESLVHSQDERTDVKFASRYSGRFHGEFKEIEITNPELTDGSKLLIVGDSFTNCIERLLATHYETTVVFDPRDTAGNDGETVAEMIERHGGFDDVVFIFNSTALTRSDVLDAMKL